MIRTAIKLCLATSALAFAALVPSVALADDAPAPTKGEKLVAQGGGAAIVGGGGGGSEGIKDEAAGNKSEKELEEETKKNEFAGSIFLFDQSITTNSLSKGSQLSYSPLYEWWISPRLYYTVKEKFKFGLRFDIFKEFTNHEDTTYAHEWRFGDPWLTAAYADKASFFNKHEKSRFAVGLLARLPLSKDSRANGQYMSLGPTGSLAYGFDVMGKKSKVFQSASFGLYANFSHAFTRCTTPCGFGFTGYNGNVNSSLDPYGRPGDTLTTVDQVRSGTLAGNTLFWGINGEIDILENLSYSAAFYWINQWSYAPSQATDYAGNPIARGPDDTRFRQLTWFLTSIDYDPIDELTVSLGYYDLNTVLAPDSSRRNPFWSPDARLFFSLTAHLDTLYDDAQSLGKHNAQTALQKASMFR
jgi:hypothetical protein